MSDVDDFVASVLGSPMSGSDIRPNSPKADVHISERRVR
jgi:hypothetical protein